jgi:hypothetical protein
MSWCGCTALEIVFWDKVEKVSSTWTKPGSSQSKSVPNIRPQLTWHILRISMESMVRGLVSSWSVHGYLCEWPWMVLGHEGLRWALGWPMPTQWLALKVLLGQFTDVTGEHSTFQADCFLIQADHDPRWRSTKTAIRPHDHNNQKELKIPGQLS